MNLFRSEEHARNWSGFGNTSGLLSLEDYMTIFGSGVFRERTSDTYISNIGEFAQDTAAVIKQVTHDDPFFRMG